MRGWWRREGRACSESISLPVIPPREKGAPRSVPRVSHIARWRALAFIMVYVLITLHVLHWWITGRSFGRFVMSDTMKTLELGEINPGVVLFGVSLLVTLVFGRFLCGWMCHIGALQDLTMWALRKVGIRPHVFRSRLLGVVPLFLALYMFVWPTFKRDVMAPALVRVWPSIREDLDIRPFPGFSADFSTQHLWDGLPSLAVGIPFLLICGGAAVYFLGARGLCRYVCPYGGFILPAEQVSVARVVVDAAKCDQCGQCTAACNAGVRVHDEVRLHGSVLDRNCVRSFDCIGACPHKALSFTFTRPAFLGHNAGVKPAAHRYDLTWTEEFLCLGVFFAGFFVLRGLYGTIPLLMAAPLAAVAGYLTWKTIRLFRDSNVRFAGMQLRLHDHITGAGRGFALGVALAALVLVQSLAVRVLDWRAGKLEEGITVGYNDALAQRNIPEDQRAAAARALSVYRWVSPVWRGGLGLLHTPEATVRVAWLEIVLGHADKAADELEALVRTGRAADHIGGQLGELLIRRGEGDRAERDLKDMIDQSADNAACRDRLAFYYLQKSRPADGEKLYRDALARRPKDGIARAGLGRLLFAMGKSDEAMKELAQAATDSLREPVVRQAYAQALGAMGHVDQAAQELESAAAARPAAKHEYYALASQILRAGGRDSAAEDFARRADEAH